MIDIKRGEFQNHIFFEFIDLKGIKENSEFSKDSFIDFLMDKIVRYEFTGNDTARCFADIVFVEAEAKGLIRKLNSGTLEEYYILVKHKI